MASGAPTLPTKLHFFKPLLPGFLHDFLIPATFFTEHLGGDPDREDQCKGGVLRSSSGKPFPVTINGRRLEAGWPEFAAEHNLHVGDFVVFGHEGGLVFDVRAYDLSACQRLYPLSVDPGKDDPGEDVGRESQPLMVEDDSDVEPMSTADFVESGRAVKEEMLSMDQPITETVSSRASGHVNVHERATKKQKVAIQPKATTASFPSHPKHPTFVHILTRSNIVKSNFYMPPQFAWKNGLSGRLREMILRDEEGRLWPVQLRCYVRRDLQDKDSYRVLVGRGLRKLIIANDLKMGDFLRFELVEKGAKPVANIYVLTRGTEQSNSTMKIKSKSRANPCQVEMEQGSDAEALKIITVTREMEKSKLLRNHKSKSKSKSKSVRCRAKPNLVVMEETFDVMPVKKTSGRRKIIIPPRRPFFVGVVNTSRKNSSVLVPSKFSRQINPNGRHDHLILKDAKGRSWPVGLSYKRYGETYFGRGWWYLINANGLKNGDYFTVVLLKQGEKPVASFRVGRPMPEAEASTSACPHFISRVKPYSLACNRFIIPLKFARANDLVEKNCMMTLWNQEGCSWPVSLQCVKSGQAHLLSGWLKFALDNHIKVEDSVRFDLIENGQNPIMKFTGERPAPEAEASASAHPHFISRVKPTSLACNRFTIPIKFARANDLVMESCEVTLRNQEGCSWPVTLHHVKKGDRVYLLSGWLNFALENRIKVGDLVRFDLIENGQNPIMNFIGKSSLCF